MITVSYADRTFTFTGRDDHIARQLAKGQFYEPKMLGYIRALNVPGVYVDAGAFIGTHTVFFAELCEACTGVLSFEPVRESFAVLQQNVQTNVFRVPVNMRNMALGAESGQGVAMDPNSDNHGTATIRRQENGECRITTIDAIAPEHVGLIKIDVEGAELDVLTGAVETIGRSRPHLFIEAVAPKYRDRITQWLATWNYRLIASFNASPTHHFAP